MPDRWRVDGAMRLEAELEHVDRLDVPDRPEALDAYAARIQRSISAISSLVRPE